MYKVKIFKKLYFIRNNKLFDWSLYQFLFVILSQRFKQHCCDKSIKSINKMTRKDIKNVPRSNKKLEINTYYIFRVLTENDCVVNERKVVRRRNRSEDDQAVRFVLCWPLVLLFHFNGTVGSAGTLMPRRARTQKSGEGIIYRKWVVRRSEVI